MGVGGIWNILRPFALDNYYTPTTESFMITRKFELSSGVGLAEDGGLAKAYCPALEKVVVYIRVCERNVELHCVWEDHVWCVWSMFLRKKGAFKFLCMTWYSRTEGGFWAPWILNKFKTCQKQFKSCLVIRINLKINIKHKCKIIY